MRFLLLLTTAFVSIESFGLVPVNFPRYSTVNRPIETQGDTRIPSYKSYSPSSSRLFSNDGDGEFGEDLTYLNEEFARLSSGKKMISFQDFLGSEAIQAILIDDDSQNYLGDIEDIWKSQAKSLTNLIDLSVFISINRQIDDLFEYVDDDEDETSVAENETQRLSDIIEGRNNNEEDVEDGEIIEVSDIDIWDPNFNTKDYFDLDFLNYLKKFYDSNTDDNNNGMLSYSSFCQWSDIKQMLVAGEIDSLCLRELWDEAIIERNKRQKKNSNTDNKSEKGFKIENDDVKKGFLDFDSFARMNIRLDVVLDEVQDALGNLTDSEVEEYYRAEFLKLSDGEELISYNQLLNWSDTQELINDNVITLDQFNSMWEALVKRPLGIFYKKQNIKGASQSDGISVDAFLVYISAIEDLDSDISTGALD